MTDDESNRPSEPKKGVSLSRLQRFLMIFWALSFAAVGVLVLGGSGGTHLELSDRALRTEEGGWDLPVVEAACREALEAHGVDPASATQVAYAPPMWIGENLHLRDRALTAWVVEAEGRRLQVSLERRDGALHCLVSDGK